MQEHFRTLGDHVNETKQEVMRAQMGSFKQSLEEFALKYKCVGSKNVCRVWMDGCDEL